MNGVARSCPADDRVPHRVLEPPAGSDVPAAVRRAALGAPGTADAASRFTVRGAPARPSNTYICNQTHWKALRSLELAATPAPKPGRLRSAFFVHIPYPEHEDEFGPLADALHEVIAQLVGMEQGQRGEQ